MTKILILLKTFDGGTGTFVNDLLKIKESDQKFHIKIAVLEKPSLKRINNNKINFFANKNFYPEKYQISLKVLFTLIKEVFWLKKIINELRPDILISIDSHCLILSQVTKQLFFRKVKLIATVHNNIEAVINHKTPKSLVCLIKILIGDYLNRADKVICVSKGVSDHLYHYFNLKGNPKVIYYGLNSVYLSNKTQKAKEFNQLQTKIILVISRLFPQKDIKTIIKAFELVKNKLPNSKLWIVGDGPLKLKLKLLFNHLKLKDVKFFGWIDNPIKMMRVSDIFVFSSHWEGFAYTIIEAMSQALPIVATDTPFGPREILDNGKYGVLVPMKDLQAMAKAMYELLTNEKKYRYYSQKSLERVKFFSLDKMLKAYKKVILNLINKQ